MEQTNYILNNIDNKLQLLIDLFKKSINGKTSSNIIKKKTKHKKKKKTDTKKQEIKVNVFKEKQIDYKKKIYLAQYKNALLLHGDTFSKKDIIKKVGGIWSYNNKGWILSNDSFDYIVSKIPDLQYNRDKIFEYELLDKNNIAYKITSKKIEEEKASVEMDEYYLLNTDSE